MPKSVADFKAAFMDSAKVTNKKIRWTTPTKFWQTQTSLLGVKDALQGLEGCPEGEVGTRLAEVRKAIKDLDPKKREKYEDAIKELEEDLVAFEDQAEFTKFKAPDGQFGFRDADGKVLAKGLTQTRADFVYNVMGKMKDLAGKSGVAIDDLPGLLESILSDPKMGATSSDIDASVWKDAIKHVDEVVLPGIKSDMEKLKSTGLVGKGAALKGVRFTGSDFHKGGKQVLILRFEENGQEKKVVYKPSSLKVDSLLYGDDGIASTLGGISTYNIVPAESEKDGSDLGYGYMEFIETGGSPSSADDVVGVFVGIAENMAMSYYVGLDDVHQENIIVKKNGVQVIDMEATTGVFNPVGTATSGGFYDQLWQKAIYEGVRVKFEKLIAEGTLTKLPADAQVGDAMKKRFREVIAKMAEKASAKVLKAIETELANQTTRTVPIATNTFQKVLIPKAKEVKTIKEWRQLLDATEGPGLLLLQEAKGTTSTPIPTIRLLLYTKGVFGALQRGDVPYYTRSLGSDKVCDEAGEEIAVVGYAKVGKPIQTAMAERRTQSTDEALRLFDMQAIKQMTDSMEKMRTALEIKKATR